jgi:hypothetical protein
MPIEGCLRMVAQISRTYSSVNFYRNVILFRLATLVVYLLELCYTFSNFVSNAYLVNSILGLLHCVYVSDFVHVSEVLSASTYRIEMFEMDSTYTQTQLAHCNSEDGGNFFIRNVSNIVHMHAV